MSQPPVRIILTDENSMVHWPNGSVEFIGSAATPFRTCVKTVMFAWSLRRRGIPFVVE